MACDNGLNGPPVVTLDGKRVNKAGRDESVAPTGDTVGQGKVNACVSF